MPRILLVEDETAIAGTVLYALREEGHAATHCLTAGDALEQAAAEAFDLAILDVGLPDLGGFALCRRLREQRDLPVIFLTARQDEADRILGFELGADDYVPKPFSPRELVARVRAVLRRSQAREVAEADEAVEHRGLRVDPLQRQASFAGREVELTTLEFDLLFALARAPGRVFSRNDLIERVWGPDFGGVDRVVDVHVSNLRQKLASVGADALLVTVRGVGYKVA